MNLTLKTALCATIMFSSVGANFSYAACEAEQANYNQKQADTLLWAGRERIRQTFHNNYVGCRATAATFSCRNPDENIPVGNRVVSGVMSLGLAEATRVSADKYSNPCFAIPFPGGAVPAVNEPICRDLCLGNPGPGINRTTVLAGNHASGRGENSCTRSVALGQLAQANANNKVIADQARNWAPSFDLKTSHEGVLTQYTASQTRFIDADAALKQCKKAAQSAALVAPLGTLHVNPLTPTAKQAAPKGK